MAEHNPRAGICEDISADRVLPEFVHPHVYYCVKCIGILREPLQTRCGHRLCLACYRTIQDGLSIKGPQLCPAGEEDCDYITPESVHSDISAKKEMSRLEVHCLFRQFGCERKMLWKDLNQHALICDWATVSCPNQGCTEHLPKNSIQTHIETHCKYRRIQCEQCEQLVWQGFKEQHLQEECPDASLPCPHKCGEQAIKRRYLAQHAQNCRRKPLECKYKTIGCNVTGCEADLLQHDAVAVEQHLGLVASHATTMQDSVVILEQALQNNQTEEAQLKVDLDSKKQELASLKQLLDHHAKKAAMIQKSVASTEHSVAQLQTIVATFKSWYQESETSRNQQLLTLQEGLRQHSRRLEDTERNCLVVGSPDGQSSAVSKELDRQSTQLAMCDVRLAEMDIRFSCLETADYSGLLIWKICDYSRRKRDAVAGVTLSLCSQPFFTSRTGYKMCARVYLNGDGLGKDTHMSLFFSLMKGDYDELLTWPFTKKITLSLLDQCGGRGHLSDTFRADPSSSSFQRPIRDMNIACGCPLFVAQSLAEGPPYLVDDTIFIQVKVEEY